MLGPSGRPWGGRSAVQSLVDQACDPTLLSPNDVAIVELIELINKKKGNSAREATHALLVYINSRNPNQSLLALNVLDRLVKTGGYPIYLQISTKEFLNELVRRFPERPPMVIGRVMGRILELIHEWKNTICVTSKYKDDLVHIRDMHRLLSYKGYRFKAFDAARAMANVNPNQDLKSPDELEEEDRAAKQAKLQELIRRATPRDLAAAQELMKELSGAEPEKAVDYEKQTLTELDKVQSKAILLNDMLDNAKEDERIGLDGDVYDQVAAACRGARPKIQQWIEKDTGEHEGLMDKLLLCNDLINNALERFQAAKKGDWAAAREIAQQGIDSAAAATSAGGKGKATDDLISFDAFADDDEPSSSGGGLALPSGTAAAPDSSNPGFTAGGLPLDLFAPSPSGSPGPQSASPGPSVQRKDPMSFFNVSAPMQPQQQQYGNQFGGMGMGGMGGMGMGMGQQQQHQQQHQQQQQYGGFQAQQTQPTNFGFGSPLAPSPAASPANGRPATSAVPGVASPAPAPAAQPKKNDAFADLVDLMG